MAVKLNATRRYISIADGVTQVINLQPLAGIDQPNALVIFLTGSGTATYQPCDEDGTVVPGSSSTNATSAQIVAAAWPFYTITAGGGEACVVAAVAAQRVTLDSDVEIGAVEIKNDATDDRAKVQTTAPTATTMGLVVKPSPTITTINDGRKTVTTGGTAEALAASTACKYVIITAETDNTGLVIVGGSTVVAALATRRGTPLNAGDSVGFEIDDLAAVFLDVTVNGDGATFIYLN